MTATPGVIETRDAVRAGARSAREVVAEALDRIDRLDGALNSVRETYPERSIRRAETLDDARRGGRDPGPLAGVPILVKDNIVTSFGRTSCGSRMLEEYRSPFDATVVTTLEAAGAVVVGKANCDEFAMGSSTEHCAWGPVRNPWDPERVPGGSSGGSAAAVAAGLVPAALGSDTGGSVRQPAALCGVVGLKPSFGRVSRSGLVAFGSSLDQVGPIATSVADAALLLEVLAGADPLDSTCADVAVPSYGEMLESMTADVRIGVARSRLGGEDHPAVDAAVEEAIEVYRGLGATIVEVELPLTVHGLSTYYVLAPAEASSNLARYDGIRYGRRATMQAGDDLEDLYARSRSEGFGPEVQRRIMLGTYVLSAGYHDAYYRRAQRVRRLIRDEQRRAFERCDALLGPTAPAPAFRLGEKPDPVSMYRCDVHTVIANITGTCAVSLPAGTVSVDGRPLPIGLQLQAPEFREDRLLAIARAYERETAGRRPRRSVDVSADGTRVERP